MNTENKELLSMIDNINGSTIASEINVSMSICESYMKLSTLAEYCDESVIQEFSIFTEADESNDEKKKGGVIGTLKAAGKAVGTFIVKQVKRIIKFITETLPKKIKALFNSKKKNNNKEPEVSEHIQDTVSTVEELEKQIAEFKAVLGADDPNVKALEDLKDIKITFDKMRDVLEKQNEEMKKFDKEMEKLDNIRSEFNKNIDDRHGKLNEELKELRSVLNGESDSSSENSKALAKMSSQLGEIINDIKDDNASTDDKNKMGKIKYCINEISKRLAAEKKKLLKVNELVKRFYHDGDIIDPDMLNKIYWKTAAKSKYASKLLEFGKMKVFDKNHIINSCSLLIPHANKLDVYLEYMSLISDDINANNIDEIIDKTSKKILDKVSGLVKGGSYQVIETRGIASNGGDLSLSLDEYSLNSFEYMMDYVSESDDITDEQRKHFEEAFNKPVVELITLVLEEIRIADEVLTKVGV